MGLHRHGRGRNEAAGQNRGGRQRLRPLIELITAAGFGELVETVLSPGDPRPIKIGGGNIAVETATRRDRFRSHQRNHWSIANRSVTTAAMHRPQWRQNHARYDQTDHHGRSAGSGETLHRSNSTIRPDVGVKSDTVFSEIPMRVLSATILDRHLFPRPRP